MRLTDPENAKDFHSELNKCELGFRVFSQDIPKFNFKDSDCLENLIYITCLETRVSEGHTLCF